MEKIKELSGYSGCLIRLYKEKEIYFVRKESLNRNYNERLKLQIEKQEKQLNIKEKPFDVPKILNTGYNDKGLYYVDMEYISGYNFIEYINLIEYDKIEKYVNKLFEIIIYFEKKRIDNNQDTWNIFFKKTNSILRKNIDNVEIINYFYNFLNDKETEIKSIDKTECHGDLTLENILIADNDQIYLIDFLDNFYDSFYFDIAKIYQDLKYKWYEIKNEKIKISRNKILFFEEKFDSLIEERFKNKKEIINYFSLLNLLRILPYTSKKDIRYKKIEDIIKQNITRE